MRALSVVLAVVLATGLAPAFPLQALAEDAPNGALPQQPQAEEPNAVGGVYQIGTIEELAWFAQAVNEGSANLRAVLTADIAPDEPVAWVPIGSSSAPFTGSFDGAGHSISNLVVNCPEQEGVGIFGGIAQGAVVANVYIAHCSVVGRMSVGALVGSLVSAGGSSNGLPLVRNCMIEDTSVSGTVLVGGLVGCASMGVIANCGVVAAVSGQDQVGGLAGTTSSTYVFNCMVYADVESPGTKGIVGGSGTVNWATCGQFGGTYNGLAYYLAQDGLAVYGSGQNVVASPKSEEQFSTSAVSDSVLSELNYYVEHNPDASLAMWVQGDSYPRLNLNQMGAGGGISGETLERCEPEKAQDGWYVITTPQELAWFADAVNGESGAHYARLARDIVVQDTVLNADGSLNRMQDYLLWTPIGTEASPFEGSFDGQGFTISGLYINEPDAYVESFDNQGLFGYIGAEGSVCNLTVSDSYISAKRNSGAIAGTNAGTIEGCASFATVCADYLMEYNGADYGDSSYTGGIVGQNAGTVASCDNHGSVSSRGYYTGGVVGSNAGLVSRVSNDGAVTATSSFTGGIAGMSRGSISEAFNYASVSGSSYLGGIVGSVGADGLVQRSYNAGAVVSSALSGVGAVSGGGSAAASYIHSYYLRGSYAWGVVSADDSEGVEGVCMVESCPEAAYALNTDDATAENAEVWAASAEYGRLVLATDGAHAPFRIELVGTAGNVAGVTYRAVYSDAAGVISLLKADPKEPSFRFDGLYGNEGCTALFASAEQDLAQVQSDMRLYAKLSYVEGLVHEPYPDEVEDVPSASLPVHEELESSIASYEVHTDHYGEWVMQSDGSAIDLQVVKATLRFDRPVRLLDKDQLGAELAVRINLSKAQYCSSTEEAEQLTYADPNAYRFVIDGLSEDGCELSLTVFIGYAIYAGHLFIESPAEGLANLVYEDEEPQEAILAVLHCIVPNGLTTETVQATVATESTPASTITRFIAPQEEGSRVTRAMTHIMVLKNGQPVYDTLNTNWATIESHWHDYQNLTVHRYLQMLVGDDGVSGWFASEPRLLKDYVFSYEGDEVTITAKNSAPGDVLEIQVSSYLNNGSVQVDKTFLASAIEAARDLELRDEALDDQEAYAELSNALALAEVSLESPYYSQECIDGKAARLADAVVALGSTVDGWPPDDGSDEDDAPVAEESEGAWISDGGRWWYSHGDGTWTANGWELIDGTWYLFDADGWMLTGWQKWAGSWYYLQPSGALYAGWLSWGGSWYYLDPENDSAMATGWFLDGETWYYADASGAMQTGWLKDGGSWYYLQPSGAMLTGWLSWGGEWYYLAESGAMATGWVNDGGTWYYLYASGVMAHDCWVGDYYLTSSGAMAVSAWVDGGRYYVGPDGAWVPGA